MRHPATLICMLPLFLSGCSGPEIRRAGSPPESVGVADVERCFSFGPAAMSERSVRVGQLRIPLGGRLFTLHFARLGRLGPEDFRVDNTDGFGTTRARIHLTAIHHPLEAELIYSVRLGDPTFEKSLRLRWLGAYNLAPRLDRVTIEDIPVTGMSRGGGKGVPLLSENFFLLSSSPGGRSVRQGERIQVVEEPKVILGGGWWTSGVAVLGPSGRAPAESALLRWLVHRRGATTLTLLEEGDESQTPLRLPKSIASPLPLVKYRARPESGRSGDGGKPTPRALLLGVPADLHGGGVQLVRLLLAGWRQLPGGGCLILDGPAPPRDPRAFLDLLERCRTLADATRPRLPLSFAVRWAEGAPAAPFLWRYWLEYQRDRSLGCRGPWLGRTGLSLTPWRLRGQKWSRELADALVLRLARGVGCINLGVLPPAGAGRLYLESALVWAGARDELLQVMRNPLAGELSAGAEGKILIARRREEVLLVVERVPATGREGSQPAMVPAQWLPQGTRWERIIQVYPDFQELDDAGQGLGPIQGRVRVLHAWTDQADPAEPLRLDSRSIR